MSQWGYRVTVGIPCHSGDTVSQWGYRVTVGTTVEWDKTRCGEWLGFSFNETK